MDFEATLGEHRLHLTPLAVETLQVNLGQLCNQACRHCHVDAGPKRTEQMDGRTVARCLEILAAYPSILTLDITGGAPELNEHFTMDVTAARKLGKRVIMRHNFTVMLDPHPVSGESLECLPAFFREHGVELISSLPYYRQEEADRQRGDGVFTRSIEAMRRLNALGYGVPGTANTVWDFDHAALVSRRIMFGNHCYGCTAGAGSSCGGAVVS